MITGIIILSIILIISICIIITKDEEFCNGIVWGMFITLVITASILFIAEDAIEPKPTAMDVYQGKTTLEITYKDGIPIDSVVVFKN